MLRSLKPVLIASFLGAGAVSAAPSDMSLQVRAKAEQAVDAGVKSS